MYKAWNLLMFFYNFLFLSYCLLCFFSYCCCVVMTDWFWNFLLFVRNHVDSCYYPPNYASRRRGGKTNQRATYFIHINWIWSRWEYFQLLLFLSGVCRRVARNSQWGLFWGYGGWAPPCRRSFGVWGREPAAGGTGVWGGASSAQKFCISLQK